MTQSGNGITTLQDLVISQWDGDNGFGSLPGSKMKGSRHLSWT